MDYINLERLNELKELDEDGSTLKELIRLFTKNTHLKMKNILDLFQEKDFVQMRREAHGLRSSGLNLGAEKLSHTLLKIEYSSDHDIDEKLAPAIQSLESDCHFTLTELNNLLERI